MVKLARLLTRPVLSPLDFVATIILVPLIVTLRWHDAVWWLAGSAIINVALKRFAARPASCGNNVDNTP